MPLLDLFLVMLWLFLFIIWIWLVFVVIGDLFRNDMSGWAKALWALLLVILPFVGVFAYVIARHGKIHEPAMARAMFMDLGHRNHMEAVTGYSVTSTAEFKARTGAPLR